jgi:hypothetical protein
LRANRFPQAGNLPQGTETCGVIEIGGDDLDYAVDFNVY